MKVMEKHVIKNQHDVLTLGGDKDAKYGALN
jgi:hypothetical protein